MVLQQDTDFITQADARRAERDTPLRVRPIVQSVSMDERCYGLFERDGWVNYRKENRVAAVRLQTILVVRGDEIAEFKRIIGPAKGLAPLQLLGPFGEDSVGEMVDEADRSRDDDYGVKLREEVRQSSTLIRDAIQEREENVERIANRSVFGPARTKQRNGFSRKGRVSRR